MAPDPPLPYRRDRRHFAVSHPPTPWQTDALAGDERQIRAYAARTDIFRKYCEGVQPGGGRIAASSRHPADALSTDCRAVFDAIRRQRRMRFSPSPLAEPAGSGTSNDPRCRCPTLRPCAPVEETLTFVPRPLRGRTVARLARPPP